MAVFDHMPMGEEGVRQVYSWIDSYLADNRGIAEKISLGRSDDNKWDIPAVVVTNRSIPADEKQNAIVTLARHGQERGTRVVGAEILNFLASDDAREIRDKQTVIVVPVVNPEGFILDEFHSSLYGITDFEKKIWGNLCAAYSPDMMLDYHSLGKTDATKYDRGDMEVIIPANTTKWGMDEQIHQYVANEILEAAAAQGWPYEIHTLEDLSFYYFGDPDGSGRLPQRYLQEKVFLLHIQNHYEHYDSPEQMSTYTNYTNGPAYLKYHTLVFGIELNHWSLDVKDGLAESGLVPCQALLNMGNTRFPWEKDAGYPTNILVGDFRISIRPSGKNPGERRISRERIWGERANFDILKREMPDPETTLAEVGYLGENLPLEFDLCLRMRQNLIDKVTIEDQEVEFETFKDKCSTFVSIPMTLKKAGLTKLKVTHEPFKRRS
jgi:hypothetical protein